MSVENPVAVGTAIIIPVIPDSAKDALRAQMEAAIRPLEENLRKASVNATEEVVKPFQDNQLPEKFKEPGKKAGMNFKAAFVASAAIGAVIFSEMNKIQEGFNRIRIGTGATGQAFESLKGTAKEVAREVDMSFGDVANTIADLNTRFGLTGQALKDYSIQALNLAEITGESATSITRTTNK
jgi:hypothetical protein